MTGKIYELDLDTNTENGGIIERAVTTGTIASQNGRFIRHDRVEIDFDCGEVGGAQAAIAWVNDGERDFINYKAASLGALGAYTTRVYWNRLGKARSRIYRLRVTDPIPFRVKGCYYFASGGR